jgi:hypothetical protein
MGENKMVCLSLSHSSDYRRGFCVTRSHYAPAQQESKTAPRALINSTAAAQAFIRFRHHKSVKKDSPKHIRIPEKKPQSQPKENRVKKGRKLQQSLPIKYTEHKSTS